MADFLTSIGDMLGLNKGKGTIAAADSNQNILKGLEGKLGGLVTQGDNQARGYLENNLGLTSLGQNANGILGDIYGLNGQAGADNARSMFQTGPGYQFQQQEGLQALDRRAAASGRMSSGNADMDTMRFSQGLADSSWGDWVNGITGGIERQAGANGDLATLAGQTTNQRIGLAGDIGSGYMNANNQRAAGSEAGQGAIWDLLGNVAGVAGAAFGLGGKPPGSSGAPAAPGAPPGQMPAFGGYGRY
jgi:hypothetical protein